MVLDKLETTIFVHYKLRVAYKLRSDLSKTRNEENTVKASFMLFLNKRSLFCCLRTKTYQPQMLTEHEFVLSIFGPSWIFHNGLFFINQHNIFFNSFRILQQNIIIPFHSGLFFQKIAGVLFSTNINRNKLPEFQ